MDDHKKERAVNETKNEISLVKQEVNYHRKAFTHLKGGLLRLRRQLKKDDERLKEFRHALNTTAKSNGTTCSPQTTSWTNWCSRRKK